MKDNILPLILLCFNGAKEARGYIFSYTIGVVGQIQYLMPTDVGKRHVSPHMCSGPRGSSIWTFFAIQKKVPSILAVVIYEY